MKKISTHTPTPWRWKVDKNFPQAVRVYSDNIEISSVSKHAKDLEEAQANAAFIVRAVNAHEALLDSLKLAITQMREAKMPVALFEQAIAKAEGRS